jgi:hypothetical protein
MTTWARQSRQLTPCITQYLFALHVGRHILDASWTTTVVLRHERLHGAAGVVQAGPRLSNPGLTPLTRRNRHHGTEQHDKCQHRSQVTKTKPSPHPPMAFPREKNPRVGYMLSCHDYCTSWFICMSGMRMASTIKPTLAPRKMIMTGSRSPVSAVTRVSTSASYARATFSSICSS